MGERGRRGGEVFLGVAKCVLCSFVVWGVSWVAPLPPLLGMNRCVVATCVKYDLHLIFIELINMQLGKKLYEKSCIFL